MVEKLAGVDLQLIHECKPEEKLFVLKSGLPMLHEHPTIPIYWQFPRHISKVKLSSAVGAMSSIGILNPCPETAAMKFVGAESLNRHMFFFPPIVPRRVLCDEFFADVAFHVSEIAGSYCLSDHV